MINNCSMSDAKLSSPFNEVQRLPVIRQESVTASVVCLLNTRGPSHIARFIVAVLVRVAVKAHSIGTFAHVVKERLKVVFPIWTNGHASLAIPLIEGTAFVKASLLHPRPNIIFPRASCLAVFDALPRKFRSQTTTTFSQSACKTGNIDAFDSAACALTKPMSMATFIWCTIKNRPTTKNLFSPIYQNVLHAKKNSTFNGKIESIFGISHKGSLNGGT